MLVVFVSLGIVLFCILVPIFSKLFFRINKRIEFYKLLHVLGLVELETGLIASKQLATGLAGSEISTIAFDAINRSGIAERSEVPFGMSFVLNYLSYRNIWQQISKRRELQRLHYSNEQCDLIDSLVESPKSKDELKEILLKHFNLTS